MNKKCKVDSIIFDLDGTLWDTKVETLHSVNDVLDKYDLEHIDLSKIESAMGHTDSEVAKLYMPNLKKEEREHIFREMVISNIDTIKHTGGILYKGVVKTLKKLSSSYKIFIVSNCGDGYIESFLDYYKLNDLFTDFVPASKYNISKTKAINNLINKYNLKCAVYCGDTLGDYNYAKDAGIPFIHAKYGFCPELESTYQIKSINEIFDIIDKISNDNNK